MLMRDLIKMNTPNDGTRTLFESIAVPEVELALKDWKKNFKGNGILIGALAAGFYARPRQTTDIDVLFLTPQDIPLYVNGFKRTRAGAFQHNVTHVEVEVVSPESFNGKVPMEIVHKVFETAIESDGIKVASPSGIIALKLCRMQRFDEGDIWSLIETGKVDLTDWPLPSTQQQIYQSILNKINQIE